MEFQDNTLWLTKSSLEEEKLSAKMLKALERLTQIKRKQESYFYM